MLVALHDQNNNLDTEESNQSPQIELKNKNITDNTKKYNYLQI